MDELEKIIRGSDGFTITHTRAKQRSDTTSTKFLVPEEGGFANMLAVYLDKVKTSWISTRGGSGYRKED